MLKQILADMYVEPELLAELSEEQKQILFFKMRQEQIRRWKEREGVGAAEQVGGGTTTRQKKKAAPGRKTREKSVQWKLGADGDIWVWVMGEHTLDKPYDLLCSEILAERMRQLSLQEAEVARSNAVEALHDPSITYPCLPSDSLCFCPEMRDCKSTAEWAVKPVVKNARTQEQVQPPTNKSRGVEEMLADSVSKWKKFSSQQQRKEAEMRTTRTEEAALNHVHESMQKSEKEDPEWLESLRRSKAADEKRRSLAKQARDDYKRLSLQGAHKGKVAEGSKTEPRRLPPPPLPPKPKHLAAKTVNGRPDRKRAVQRTVSSATQEGIVRWFKEEQLHLQAGFDKSSCSMAPWFHGEYKVFLPAFEKGILTTKDAEELLSASVPGSFLIRVSEKIKGYVLSYLSSEGCKHFLIDASGDSYSFLGVDQLQHSTLADLVDYHKDEPITSLGRELLRYPCGQREKEPPDYLDLFE